MSDILPEAIRKGLEDARKASVKLNSRLCVHDGDQVHRIVQMWDDGFTLDVGIADTLRGRVEVYDGARHLYQCLVVGSERDGDYQRFDFKWVHPVTATAPVDFVRDDFVPAGLLARS